MAVYSRNSDGTFRKSVEHAEVRRCSIEDCENILRAKGWCQKHYMRWYHHGDVFHRPGRIRGTARERLDNMTDVDASTGCKVWRGSVDTRGYGRMVDDSGWADMAHRLSYKLYKGDIPKGLVIHHKCYNTRCVNPDHLEATTHYENIITKGKTNAAFVNANKTHCIRGHNLDNSYIQKTKWGKQRICKKCHKLRMRRYTDGKNG